MGLWVSRMSEELHDIDRPKESKKYDSLELDEFMVFCILDTAVPYEMCCKAFDALRKKGYTTRRGLKSPLKSMIAGTLKKAGYRFPKQHAGRLKNFSKNTINLKTATRKELVENINGIGMKLASMFLRNTRGHQYAVLDRHTLRFLDRHLEVGNGIPYPKTYEEKEKLFISIAKDLGRDPMELDLEIWQRERVGNR